MADNKPTVSIPSAPIPAMPVAPAQPPIDTTGIHTTVAGGRYGKKMPNGQVMWTNANGEPIPPPAS